MRWIVLYAYPSKIGFYWSAYSCFVLKLADHYILWHALLTSHVQITGLLQTCLRQLVSFIAPLLKQNACHMIHRLVLLNYNQDTWSIQLVDLSTTESRKCCSNNTPITRGTLVSTRIWWFLRVSSFAQSCKRSKNWYSRWHS